MLEYIGVNIITSHILEVNIMDTIKIGTSENCDIKFYGKDITSSVWTTISASDKKMLVLKILANNVRCFVNNNNVADQYWIKYGDCTSCKMWRYCEGNGMHLRDDKGDLLLCNMLKINTFKN